MRCIDVSVDRPTGRPALVMAGLQMWPDIRGPPPNWPHAGVLVDGSAMHCRLSSKVRVLPDPQSRAPAMIAMAWPRHFLGDIYSLWCPAGFLEAHSWSSLCSGRERGLASQVDVTVYVPVSDEAMLSYGLSSPRQTCPTLGLDVELISWWASIHWEVHYVSSWLKRWNIKCPKIPLLLIDYSPLCFTLSGQSCG